MYTLKSIELHRQIRKNKNIAIPESISFPMNNKLNKIDISSLQDLKDVYIKEINTVTKLYHLQPYYNFKFYFSEHLHYIEIITQLNNLKMIKLITKEEGALNFDELFSIIQLGGPESTRLKHYRNLFTDTVIDYKTLEYNVKLLNNFEPINIKILLDDMVHIRFTWNRRKKFIEK